MAAEHPSEAPVSKLANGLYACSAFRRQHPSKTLYVNSPLEQSFCNSLNQPHPLYLEPTLTCLPRAYSRSSDYSLSDSSSASSNKVWTSLLNAMIEQNMIDEAFAITIGYTTSSGQLSGLQQEAHDNGLDLQVRYSTLPWTSTDANSNPGVP